MSRRNSLIDINTIKAYGDGLKGGKIGEECKFTIGGTDGGLALSFHIEGPSRPIFETMTGKEMTLDICYIPTMAVSIVYDTTCLPVPKILDGSLM